MKKFKVENVGLFPTFNELKALNTLLISIKPRVEHNQDKIAFRKINPDVVYLFADFRRVAT